MGLNWITVISRKAEASVLEIKGLCERVRKKKKLEKEW